MFFYLQIQLDLVLFVKNKKKIRIYIDGADNIGWSIDSDRKHIVDILNLSDSYEIVDSIKKADIIHNIWWNNIINTFPDIVAKKKYFFCRKPKVIVTCSNYIDPRLDKFDLHEEFKAIKKIADAWLCPSQKQLKILKGMGLKAFYFPFNVDHSVFKPVNKITKQAISALYEIDYEKIKNKIVIGSFQRDSLGNDLSKPKWQKDPDLLIYLLKDLPAEKYILLLAGPRRHYVINQCKKNNIPYCYIGDECVDDDLIKNALPIERMPLLYGLLDIYLITSKSEGGPKAAIEAAATKTFIMSTDVGLASDFIDNRFVFYDQNKYKKELTDFVMNYQNNQDQINQIIELNYKTFIEILDEENMRNLLSDIYYKVL